MSVLKAVRLHCIECCCGSANEVKLCPCRDCALYPYRMGKNPNVTYSMTPARAEALKRAQLARKALTAANE